MSEIVEIFLNDTAYAQTSRTTEWINVSTASSLTYSVYCSEDCDLQINWSFDDDYQITHTDTYALTGGTQKTVQIPKKDRFAQFNVQNISATPSDLKCALFFLNDASIGVETVSNIGGFNEIFISPNQVKTLQSSDASITITDNGDNLDLTSNATETPITNYLSPGALGGVSQIQNGSAHRLFWLGNSSDITWATSSNSNTPSINWANNPSTSPFERVLYDTFSDHYAIRPIVKNDNIQLGVYNDTSYTNNFNRSNGAVYIASYNCSSIDNDLNRNAGHVRIGCSGCNSRSGNGFGYHNGDTMISCISCTNRGQPHTVMINCHDLNYDPYEQTAGYSTFISVDGTSTNVQRRNINTIFIGCHSIVDNLGTGGPLFHTFIHGSKFSYNGANNGFTCFGDNSGTATSTNITNNNSMVCRFKNGYRYYTNDGLTTGTVLTAGSSSWASVCDLNKKENLSVLDTNDILNKICSIPVYKYNYIGEPVERVCYSCTAQDYHSTFNTLDYQKPRVRECTEEVKANCPPECNNNCVIPVLDEEGNQIYDTVEAKNKLVIEQMDLIGLLMSSVQELKKQIDVLNNRITILEGQ